MVVGGQGRICLDFCRWLGVTCARRDLSERGLLGIGVLGERSAVLLIGEEEERGGGHKGKRFVGSWYLLWNRMLEEMRIAGFMYILSLSRERGDFCFCFYITNL